MKGDKHELRSGERVKDSHASEEEVSPGNNGCLSSVHSNVLSCAQRSPHACLDKIQPKIEGKAKRGSCNLKVPLQKRAKCGTLLAFPLSASRKRIRFMTDLLQQQLLITGTAFGGAARIMHTLY